MTIDFVTLLHQSDSLLLFVVLAFGLLLGKVRIGNFQIGNTIGVLFTALLFGQMGSQFSTSTENVGFMLFIFCVGDQGRALTSSASSCATASTTSP